MYIDGEKLRSLRLRKGMSQEKLALMANVNKRTIQRAENSEPVRIDTIGFIAEALDVEQRELRKYRLELVSAHPDEIPKETGMVVLIPVTRGSKLVKTLDGAFKAKFEYEVEPTESNLELLEGIASVLNGAWTSPWEEPQNRLGAASDADVLRLQAKANSTLAALADGGIRVFMGTYGSFEQLPHFSPYEGMQISYNTPVEHVTNALVVVTDENVEFVTRIPSDHEDHLLEEEVPF